jgi:hypothetical protein
MDLDTIIDLELEEAGFGKKAVNPFTTKEHGRPHPEDTSSSGGPTSSTNRSSVETSRLAANIPSDSESGTRLQDFDTAKAMYRNPIVALKHAAARGLPLKSVLKKLAQDRAGQKIGMASGNEVHQAFTSSEAINRIKLAGMASALANMLPEELVLPLIRKFKGTQIFPHAADVEAFLLGKGLRSAAEGQNMAKAQRLFEGAGGVPSIDPSTLAALQMKAHSYDQSNPLMQALMGAGLGGLAGAGLASHLQSSQSAGPQVMKVVPQ